MKSGSNVEKSSKEGYGFKISILPVTVIMIMMMMMMIIMRFYKSSVLSLRCIVSSLQFLSHFPSMHSSKNRPTALDLRSIYFHAMILSLFTLKCVCLRIKLSVPRYFALAASMFAPLSYVCSQYLRLCPLFQKVNTCLEIAK
jgi:hypothetical protein